jgi:hypothetical protein
MTQTLDVAERLSQLDGSHAIGALISITQTRVSKFRTFAITFGIAFTLLYTVYERLNWPLFTYQPRTGVLYFWLHRPLPAEGPPMYWYGWIVLAAASAFVVGLIGTIVPDQRLRQGTFFCCVLGALWPTVLAVLRSFGADWQSLDAEFMNSIWAAGNTSFGRCGHHQLFCSFPVRATRVDQLAVDRADRRAHRARLLAHAVLCALDRHIPTMPSTVVRAPRPPERR